MYRRFAPVLAAFALVAFSVPALAVDKGLRSQYPGLSVQQVKDIQTGKTAAPTLSAEGGRLGGVVFSPGAEQCIDNPRFNPDNDESGPRASEPYTDSTPYAGTATALASVNCR
ncbi:hypothetical protein [Gloeobacter morelensis]|uniref:Uncharacterized protein n=1 Tax=Gloeobacter morelensis MG652769 TaxID=2781736 RepID=A0ABY3PI29_9CYAN|nr:hypothetical protein [Gloeobacter morelensis]UFP92832.1 hypothetical protein ISF26_13460 [Gloeobacter morelensis MG652769]UFP93302.1 hypothetical protein ISF26_16040 [Gloeobacter morelensis MG652769]